MRRVAPLIRRAVMLAIATSCGTSESQSDGGGPDAAGPDVSSADAPADTSKDAPTDAGIVETSVPPTLPLPDGCVVSDKPDVFLPCGYTEVINDAVTCGVDTTVESGIQDANVCFVLCDPTEPDCIYYVYTDEDGDTTPLINCGYGCIGRLHERARDAEEGRCAHLHTTAAYLARAAALEAAAVDAFEIMAGELERFGAPPSLALAARRSAVEEADHARRVGELARRWGAAALTPVEPARRPRDLRTFAIENAVEGCVRETFGAALALWQAERASDPVVREVMGALAADEAEHAELGWRVDAWLASVLEEDDRRAVVEARRRAASEVLAASRDMHADGALGLPSPAEAEALARQLAATVWS